MKAVIYARYSSDSQREESIEGQIRECTEYAEHNGITVLAHYIDRALSARTADRPEFQRMITDSETQIFDLVLVWKLDRFSRDRYDSAHLNGFSKRMVFELFQSKRTSQMARKGLFWSPCWKAMRNTTQLSYPRKYREDNTRML